QYVQNRFKRVHSSEVITLPEYHALNIGQAPFPPALPLAKPEPNNLLLLAAALPRYVFAVPREFRLIFSHTHHAVATRSRSPSADNSAVSPPTLPAGPTALGPEKSKPGPASPHPVQL